MSISNSVYISIPIWYCNFILRTIYSKKTISLIKKKQEPRFFFLTLGGAFYKGLGVF